MFRLVFVSLIFLISCRSNVEVDLNNSLYLSKNNSVNANLVDNVSLELGDIVTLYSVTKKNNSYTNIPVKWSLLENIGELTVKNAGYYAEFKATVLGQGYIQIEDNGKVKKITIDVVPISDTSAPITTNITELQIIKDTESVLTLNYTDADSDLAQSCTLTNLSNIVESTTCFCDVAGVCTVGVTGTTNYTGSASFDFEVSANGKTSNVSNVSLAVVIDCPSEYIPVFGNTTLGTTDFCVMKYEAKDDGGGNAISSESQTPWVNNTADDAYGLCDAITDGSFSSGEFALISNPEWMTIARDIENNALNWSSGVVGTGCVFNGNYGTDDTCGYDGVDPEFGSGRNTKARLFLSTYSPIWDFSGNVWESVDWVAGDGVFTRSPTNANNSWMQVTTLSGSITANDLGPFGSYNSSNAMGKWFGSYDTARGYTVRGGDYDDIASGPGTGIYSMALNNEISTMASYIGFRCVYRP